MFAIHDGANGFSNKQGQLNPTGLETDIAINGPGFFIVQPKVETLLFQEEVIFPFLILVFLLMEPDQKSWIRGASS